MVCLCVETLGRGYYKQLGFAGVKVIMWEAAGDGAREKKQKQAQEGPSVPGKGVGLYLRGSEWTMRNSNPW